MGVSRRLFTKEFKLAAVRRLEQGECVILFPEGWTRRREDQVLRRFGRGVWYILQQVPQTPIVTCWIEGGWGSFFSYAGGPPTKNKRFDFWKRIDIAIDPPQALEVGLGREAAAPEQQ